MVDNKPCICVVTGTRAEYGLLRCVIEGIHASPLLQLQLVVTGMHLSPEFGYTVNEILHDGYSIDFKVEMLLGSDTPVGITKSMGLGLIGFADAFDNLKPDLVVVLGDRFEMLCVASAAMIARIPIAHIHGGESTEGLIDEAIRHSITKMSHIHFVAADQYRKRVIQLGEDPNHVFDVGGLGIDNIKNLELLDKRALEKSLDFVFQPFNFMLTFHPVTLENQSSSSQIEELFLALEKFPDVGLIFTMPNADADGRILFDKINLFCSNHLHSVSFASLGQLRYLSCIQHVDAVIGNSSSGLLEVPSFRKPTINIGDRQRGRLKASSVVDCRPIANDITSSINRVFSDEFQQHLQSVESPYGFGGASSSIVKTLECMRFEFSQLLKKTFYNIFIS